MCSHVPSLMFETVEGFIAEMALVRAWELGVAGSETRPLLFLLKRRESEYGKVFHVSSQMLQNSFSGAGKGAEGTLQAGSVVQRSFM